MSYDIVGFSHIGFAVWDIEEFQRTWGRALGVENWLVHDEGAPGGFQLHGQVIEGQTRARTTFAKIGGTCIELVQPVQNTIIHKEHLERFGPGVHHLAFWVDNLEKQIDKSTEMGWEVVYSPISLRPGLEERPVSAVADGAGWDSTLEYPPFFSFVEPRDRSIGCAIELIDSGFAGDYRAAYGDDTFYPGDLPVPETTH